MFLIKQTYPAASFLVSSFILHCLMSLPQLSSGGRLCKSCLVFAQLRREDFAENCGLGLGRLGKYCGLLGCGRQIAAHGATRPRSPHFVILNYYRHHTIKCKSHFSGVPKYFSFCKSGIFGCIIQPSHS